MEWQDIASAPKDGTLCALRFRDPLGVYESLLPHFLHDDGLWYLYEPPTQLKMRPTHWKPAPPPKETP
jgi:hypothetical protein